MSWFTLMRKIIGWPIGNPPGLVFCGAKPCRRRSASVGMQGSTKAGGGERGVAAMGPRHVGFGPGVIDEDQAGRIKPPLILSPLRPPPGDVGTILLAGVQAFF